MSEPSADFDWDKIEPQEQPPQHDEAVDAMRRLLSIALPRKSLRKPHATKWVSIRVTVAAYLLRIPGFEAVGSLADIARRFEVSPHCVRKVAWIIRDELGLPERITRTFSKPRRIQRLVRD